MRNLNPGVSALNLASQRASPVSLAGVHTLHIIIVISHYYFVGTVHTLPTPYILSLSFHTLHIIILLAVNDQCYADLNY